MIVKSLEHLNSLSKKVADQLTKNDCIFLIGDIGVGKTTFSRYLINYLQEKNREKITEVLSPTFNLLYEYDLKNIKIIGLGDSPNDLPLLLNSDIKIVIPGIDGPNLNLLDQLKDLEFTLASEPNGYGWKNEINKLINMRELS